MDPDTKAETGDREMRWMRAAPLWAGGCTRVPAPALADKCKRWVGRRGGHSPSDGLEDRVSLQVRDVLADSGARPLPRLPVLLQPPHRRPVVVP